jgi:DNA primase
MPRIPDTELERLKREVALADLCARQGIELKQHGKDLIGHCPFHDDRTPSFVVTPGKNLWHCLGACGCGGDNIQFMMKLEKVSFRHAVETLQTMAGTVPAPAKVTTRLGTAHEILATPEDDLTDTQLMGIVTDFYHATFCNQPQAMGYLQKRKCFHPEAVKRFKIGYANRTLGYRVPTTTAAGRRLKARLQKLGVLRKESGHEHLNGSVVFPITDRRGGIVTQLYGRKITDGLRKGTPLHLYLEQPKRGLWNPDCVIPGGELILCEAIIDALTFWCAGFRNVTCTLGANGINEDLWALLHDVRPRWVLCAQDNDDAGNEAVAKLAPRLAELGIGVKRVQLPPAVDVNAYACQSADASRALAGLLEESQAIVTHASHVAPPVGDQPAKHVAMVIDELTGEPLPFVDKESLETGVGWAPEPFMPASYDEVQAQREAARSEQLKEKNIALEPAPILDPKASGPSSLHPEIRGEDIFVRIGYREYRIRGLYKNTSYEALKINLRVKLDDERHHQDNVDMAAAKSRETFIRAAAGETAIKEEVLKRDLQRLLLKLEELQEAAIRRAMEPKGPVVPGMSEEEQAEAMALLRAPNLRELIIAHYLDCGVAGEEKNVEVGYYAAVSRKFDKPLGVIIQSSSAAGKTTLMEATLALMPPEECVKYSAMTGQALFYLGEADIKNKILAIAEEEGAERATYALKLLQSEGELTIASTGKDPQTGLLTTQTYHVEGPAMIFFTTTSIEIDEELANRCLTLSVDESREQTRRIHALQREDETIQGHLRKVRAAKLCKLHQNAQRLLQPIPVHNPFASRLTFPDENTRLRRDQKKYLTLIRAITFLHQHQRPRRKIEGVEHIEVTLEDIAVANELAGEVLGRSLDEMPPQTRRFLDLVHDLVRQACEEKQIEPRHHRFTQREARAFTGWSAMQVKRHLGKLSELEYALIHRGGRGQSFVYELVYNGEGKEGAKFLMGLITIEKLREGELGLAYDEDRGGQNGEWGMPGAPQGHRRGTGGAVVQNGSKPSIHAGCEANGSVHGSKTHAGVSAHAA